MIADKDSLHTWIARASAAPHGRIVLDLEADSLHRYGQKICLIQYADDHGTCLIDPLAIEDMTPFALWLEPTHVWMHGADYDMTLLFDTWATIPTLILDTQIAARLLGHTQFGLAALIEHYHGVKIDKASQKADWGKRPLSPTMMDYAHGDVKYLLNIADTLVEQLHQRGRYEWFIESCQYSMARAQERHLTERRDPWRIVGAGKLLPRGQAALRSLWHWRDSEARITDKPNYKICNNADLIRWATILQDMGPARPHARFNDQRRRRFEDAIRQFHCLDESAYPTRPMQPRCKRPIGFEAKLSQLLTFRNTVAETLQIDPALIAPRATMESIAEDSTRASDLLMLWQRNLLGL